MTKQGVAVFCLGDQVKALIARPIALARGDLPAALALTSRWTGRNSCQASPRR